MPSKINNNKAKEPVLSLLTAPEVMDTNTLVASFLPTKDLVSVSTVSQKAPTLFYKTLMKRLLQAVVNGEHDNVKAILNINPPFLLETGTVIDYSGRMHHNRTAYQLALGAGDYLLKNKDGDIMGEGMVELITEYFKKISGKSEENIQDIMRAQYNGQFPDDLKAKEPEKNKQDSEAFHNILKVVREMSDEEVQATSMLEDKIHQYLRVGDQSEELRIMTSSLLKAPEEKFDRLFDIFTTYLFAQKILISEKLFNFDLLKALYQFRNHLEPKEVQPLGKHFNAQLLIEAAQAYYENYARFGDRPDSPKNIFFWQKILGYVQRFVPACDAQCIAQGIWNILEYDNKSNKSQSFTRGGVYYPLNSDPSSELGYNCGADVNVRRTISGDCAWLFADSFSLLMSSKDTSIHSYLSSMQFDVKGDLSQHRVR